MANEKEFKDVDAIIQKLREGYQVCQHDSAAGCSNVIMIIEPIRGISIGTINLYLWREILKEHADEIEAGPNNTDWEGLWWYKNKDKKMADEERDWYLEAPEDGGKIVANDERKTIIALPAGCPHHPEIIQDFQFILKAVKSYTAARELLKKAAGMLNEMDDQLLCGDSAENENGWEDQEAFELCQEIGLFLTDEGEIR